MHEVTASRWDHASVQFGRASHTYEDLGDAHLLSPTHHLMLHIPFQVANSKILLQTLDHEREHKDVKRERANIEGGMERKRDIEAAMASVAAPRETKRGGTSRVGECGSESGNESDSGGAN